ncbi:MAG: hypothetical protein U5Q44_10335 [Dehalococcoidia bacterium]|nr:hypothetical protein [Dehalococcoidia bacterium]
MTAETADPIETMERIARDGAARAARGLASMGLSDTRIQVPAVRQGLERDVYEATGGADAPVLGTSLVLEGEGSHVLLLFKQRSGLACVDLLCGRQRGATRELDPLGASAFLEMGNMVCMAFVNAMADAALLALRPRPPVLVQGSARAALEAAQTDPAGMLLIDTVLADRRGAPSGLLVFAPHRSSVERVLELAR